MQGRARHSRALTALAGVCVLAGCGGPEAPEASPTEPPASSTGVSLAFLDGVEQAWNFDAVGLLAADGAHLLALAAGHAAYYPLTDTAPDPIWEGQCARAFPVGRMIACDDAFIDPTSGEATPIGVGGDLLHAHGDVLVVRTPNGHYVGLSSSGEERWRISSVVLQGSLRDGLLLAADPENAGAPTAVDIATGAIHSSDVLILEDGYVDRSDARRPSMAGYDANGRQVWSYEIPNGPVEIHPMVGGTLTLDDVRTCYEQASGRPDDAPGAVCLVGPEDVLLGDRDATGGVVIEGVQVPDADVDVRLFGDAEHMITFGGVSAEGGTFALWEVGADAPTWTISGVWSVHAGGQGRYLVSVTREATTVWVPAS